MSDDLSIQPIKVAVIDDNIDFGVGIKMLLARERVEIHIATNGLEGLEMAKQILPDIVLLDVVMPEMDGIEVCKKIKHTPELAGTYIVMLSGFKTQSNQMVEGLEAGADDYIARPISNRELLARIRNLMRLKRTEKALNESEERFQLLFNNAPLGYQSLDINGNFIEVNQQWLDSLGYNREEVIGKWFGDFLTPAFKDGFRQRFPIFKAQGQIHSEFEMIHKNGSILFIAFDGKIGNDINGNFKQTHCILQDITEKKRAENALLDAEWKFKALFELGPIGVAYHRMIYDEAGKPFDYYFIDANDSFNELTGMSPKGMTVRQAFPGIENDPFDWIGKYGHVAKTGETIRFEQFLESNGRWYDCVGYQYKPDYFVVAFNEITKRKEAEIALLEKEKEYRNLIEISPVAIAIIHNWKTIYFNPAAVQLFGAKKQDELLGKHIYELIHPDFHELAIDNAKILAEKGYVVMQEQKYVKLDGTVLDVETQAKSIRFNDEIATMVVMNDITERKLAQKALMKSEEKFRNFFENSVAGMSITSIDGKLNVNQAFSNIVGYSKSELMNLHWSQITHPDDIELNIKILDSILNAKKEESRWEKRYIHKNGQTVWVDISTAIVRDATGNPLYFISTIIDITGRKQAKEKLRASEENLSITLHSIGDGVISTDINGLIVNMNPVAEKLCGWALAEAAGKQLAEVFKIINADTRQIVADPVEKVFEHGEIVGLANHTVLISKDGAEYQIADSAAPIKNKNGEITGVVLVFSDVSEKYEAEVALKESEERFKALHNASFGGIAIHDKGKILECNQGLSEITGYSYDELIGMDGLLLIAPDHREMVLNKIISGYEKPYEANGIRKNGELFPMRLEARNIPYKGKSVRTVEFRDITETKLAEEALKKTKEKITEERKMLRILIDNLPDHIYIKDLEGRKVISNIADFRDLGLESEEQILGKTDLELFPGEIGQRGYADDMEVITTGKTIMWHEEDFITSKGTKRWSLSAKIPLHDSAGKIIGLVGIGHDITDRKKAEDELIAAKEHAEESDRLKSAFLANMSHEIRTPMNGILGFAELLKEPGLNGEEQQEYIRIIEKSGARMLNIINEIVDISKIEAGLMKIDMQETNINEQIEYIYTFFKPEVETKGMKLFFNTPLSANEATITTDREKLYAILINLVKNAIKYTKEGAIEFGYKRVETLHATSLPGQTFLQFYVKDTGIGIPKDRQEAIFERFIQADIADKMAYQGAGLGLSITKAYVEMLGGKIWVESEVGEGSTFYFILPYNAEPAKEDVGQEFAISDKTDQVKKLKILIAEDDDVSEMLLDKTVKMFGKEILKARTGVEAVEACKKNPDIDLVLMDIRMPDMGGHEATRRIREFNSDVVIIAQTAYGLSGDREKAIEAGCNDYVAKPIKRDELMKLIQKYFGK